MRTFGSILEERRGIGPGFDFLRLALALSIVGLHALTTTNHYFAPRSLDDTAFWIVHYSLVPMFFAVSGFLICGSAMRLSLWNFLINRGLRIVPALLVNTCVCALVIGPIVTTVPWRDYFFSSQFATFFLNVIGWVHFSLPGVFTTHPVARVNGSLWTVPFELVCYALISALILTRALHRRWLVLGLTLSYLVTAAGLDATGAINQIGAPWLARLFSIAFLEYEAQAVTAFLFGVALYQSRGRIPYSPKLFAAAVAVTLAIAFVLPMPIGAGTAMRFILLPTLAYITVFIGLTPMPLPRFFRTGDYSYGIYLYHQPLLQIVIVLFPVLSLASPYGGLFTFAAGLPFVIGVAWLSWHVIEKPILAMRRRYSIAARQRLAPDPHTTATKNTLAGAAGVTTGS